MTLDEEDEALDGRMRAAGLDPNDPQAQFLLTLRAVILPVSMGLVPELVGTDEETLGFGMGPLLQECILMVGEEVSLATMEVLGEVGVDLEEALECAQAASVQEAAYGQAVAPGVLVFQEEWLGHGMLHDGAFLEALEERLGGECVVGLPDPHTLVVGRIGAPRAEARLVEEVLERYKAAEFAVSPRLYSLGSEGLEPWRPGRGHPAMAATMEAAALLNLNTCLDQREALQPWLDRQGDGLVVAELEVARRGEGVFTAVVWDGREGRLLPEADLLAVELRGNRMFVPWGRAMEALRGAVEVVEGYGPDLLRTQRATPDQLIALQTAAVSMG